MSSDDIPSYPISREKLYEMAWSEPMTSIAKKLGVSSSYLARVYTVLNVPRPSPGYWTKIAAGYAVKIPELPRGDPDNDEGWDRHHFGSMPIAPKQLRTSPPRKKATQQQLMNAERPQVHPLIRGAEAHFLKSRKSDIGYLRPYKRQLVDLIVSTEGLSQALAMANTLFLALEEHGYRVAQPARAHDYVRDDVDEREKPDDKDRYFKHWTPSRATLVYVGNVAIGLTLFEVSESLEAEYENGRYIPITKLKRPKRYRPGVSWTRCHDFPSGRFRLQAYSPYRDTSWAHQWDISSTASLTRFASNLANELSAYAKIIVTEVVKAREEAEARAREWEEESRRLAIEDELRKRKQADIKSRSELMGVIEKWNEVRRIGAFFDDAQRAIEGMPEEGQAVLKERLALAQQMIGSARAVDALRDWKTPDECLELIKSQSDWRVRCSHMLSGGAAKP